MGLSRAGTREDNLSGHLYPLSSIFTYTQLKAIFSVGLIFNHGTH